MQQNNGAANPNTIDETRSKYTYAAEDPRALEEIRSAMLQDRLILLAGSGLSAQARTSDDKSPPNWKDLLKGMAKWAREHLDVDEHDERDICELADHGFLLEAGQEIEDIYQSKKSKLQQCLKEVLLINEATISQSHIYIAKIRFRAYLTTNYDSLIESAYSYVNKRPLLPYYEYADSIEGVVEEFRERRPFILKLHGDVIDTKSIRLGDRSYERLLNDAINYRNSLHSVISMSSLLIIGFGGSDPDLDGLLNKVAAFDGRRQRHWMLVRQGHFPTLKAKRLLEDKGVRVIEYLNDGTHSGFERFLEKLSTMFPLARSASAPMEETEVSIKIDELSGT